MLIRIKSDGGHNILVNLDNLLWMKPRVTDGYELYFQGSVIMHISNKESARLFEILGDEGIIENDNAENSSSK